MIAKKKTKKKRSVKKETFLLLLLLLLKECGRMRTRYVGAKDARIDPCSLFFLNLISSFEILSSLPHRGYCVSFVFVFFFFCPLTLESLSFRYAGLGSVGWLVEGGRGKGAGPRKGTANQSRECDPGPAHTTFVRNPPPLQKKRTTIENASKVGTKEKRTNKCWGKKNQKKMVRRRKVVVEENKPCNRWLAKKKQKYLSFSMYTHQPEILLLLLLLFGQEKKKKTRYTHTHTHTHTRAKSS